MRVGHGFDIHKLEEGRKLIVGGIEIPHSKGLLGHSDADVLVHAIIDSLLGAACLGDIGNHFPDNNIKWKDVSSLELLKKTREKLKDSGFKIINIDSTIVAEAPKLSPYIKEMKETISQTLNIEANQINIKAKTNEGLDSIGEMNAISAYAVSLIS